jgi:hypothetical protein
MPVETFRVWLTRQAESDQDRRMPYALLYDVLGSIPDGDVDLEAWSDRFREDYPAEASEAYTVALVKAQKVYLIDQLVYAQDPDLAPAGNGQDGLDGKAVKARSTAVSITPPAGELELALEILPCGFRGKDGMTCGVPAVAGTSRCVAHGGAIGDPDVRRSLLVQAYGRMIEGADVAVAALIEVAVDGRSEMARVQAAKELLDRVGMIVDARPNFAEPVESDDDRKDAAIASLRNSLEDTRRRLKLVSIPVHSEVIDAEAS